MKKYSVMILLTVVALGGSSDVNMASDECQSLSPCEENSSDASPRITDGQLNNIDQSVGDASIREDMGEGIDAGSENSDIGLHRHVGAASAPIWGFVNRNRLGTRGRRARRRLPMVCGDSMNLMQTRQP